MSSGLINKPAYPIESKYFGNYVKKALGEDLITSLLLSQKTTVALYENLTEEQGDFAYAEGKWTVKQVLQHIIDTERIFCNRALRFARKDKTPLPGYDENHYADFDFAYHRTLKTIIEEFQIVRQSTIYLFESFHEDVLDEIGVAGENVFTARIIGWMLSGHNDHHNRVLREKYF